ncbi:AmmeMemoRadiSam system protein A [Thioalkalivibrio sp. ALR17-21]|uniref:AmmeMemoRadiSam system protein A n=1 Tax=Thioalkalivibrio sp. ALR17-21 TaxID=1269813 RepID=UPI000462964D|nr:AmmeMemoRadiSam system protein A [Thioalkalivibrio sp. ALR17-21]
MTLPFKPDPAARARLTEIADAGIRHAAGDGARPMVDPEAEPAPLDRPGASFVTLKREGELRGCIGSLEARRPLAEDVLHNAVAAATRDPRFAPLDAGELEGLAYSVTLLGPSEPLEADHRDTLLQALRPREDGLILQAGPRRATFLPAVWASLPDPEAFVDALLRKAGLPRHPWPEGLQAWRYGSLEFPGRMDTRNDS